MWPPYCREGLYMLPVSFARELYAESRRMSTTLPHELHDVLVTGILRRRTRRGDVNISSATKASNGEDMISRVKFLPRLAAAIGKLAQFELDAEDRFKTAWAKWYKTVRNRYHILTKITPSWELLRISPYKNNVCNALISCISSVFAYCVKLIFVNSTVLIRTEIFIKIAVIDLQSNKTRFKIWEIKNTKYRRKRYKYAELSSSICNLCRRLWHFLHLDMSGRQACKTKDIKLSGTVRNLAAELSASDNLQPNSTFRNHRAGKRCFCLLKFCGRSPSPET